MAQVKKGYYAGQTWSVSTIKTFLDSLNCPLITTSFDGSTLTVNVNNICDITFSNGTRVIYNGTTTWYSSINTYNNLYITAACNENFFYVQINCDYQSGRRFVFLYEKIDSKDYFGANGSDNVGGRGWFSIQEISMIETISNMNYNHAARLTYNCETGFIDYSTPDYLFSAGYKTDTADENFISCSTVTLDQVLTIDGTNYYSIGNNILVPLDEE